jgi:hypothetical protein
MPGGRPILVYAWLTIAFVLFLAAIFEQLKMYREFSNAGTRITIGLVLHSQRTLALNPWFALTYVILMASGLWWLIANGRTELEPHVRRWAFIGFFVSILCFLNFVLIVR